MQEFSSPPEGEDEGGGDNSSPPILTFPLKGGRDLKSVSWGGANGRLGFSSIAARSRGLRLSPASSLVSRLRFPSLAARLCPGLLISSCAFGAVDILPVGEITSGMKGVVRTVMSGQKIEEFPVEVIDVMENSAPKEDMILVRLQGEVLESTGVIRGMSGSPVYVDGRWIGAIAYTWSFAKEPLAGVTPAASMMKIWQEGPPGPGGSSKGTQTGSLQRIETPLVLSGMSGAGMDKAREIFGPQGFWTVEGGSAASHRTFAPLEPGSPVAVLMASGDSSVSGIGTVSAVDGNRVLAFGHPMFGALDEPMPMASAWVHAVMPSTMISFKLCSPGPEVGQVLKDTSSGIGGIVGQKARMFPLIVKIRDEAGVEEVFNHQLAIHPLLTPSLVDLLVSDSLFSSNKIPERATADAEIELAFDGLPPVKTRDRFSGDSLVSEMGGWAQLAFRLLHQNKFQKVIPASVTLTLSVRPGRTDAEVKRVWTEVSEFHPGDVIPIRVSLLPWQGGAEQVLSGSLRIPENCPIGPARLMVLSGLQAVQQDTSRAPFKASPRTLADLIQRIEEGPYGEDLVFRLCIRQPSLGVVGKEMSRLPASIWTVLASTGPEGEVESAKETVLCEETLTTSWVTAGMRTLPLTVEKDGS